MADSTPQNAVAYNENHYVPPSDDDESGNEDYEISLPGSNYSDEYEDTENVSTSEAVTGANNVLYHDVSTNCRQNSTLDISTQELVSELNISTDQTHEEMDSFEEAHSLQNSPPPQLDESDSDVDPSDIDDNDTVIGIPRDIPVDPATLTFKPIENFARDVEDPDDFANGWEWITQEDPGPAVEDFTGFPGLVIPPVDRTPASFFKLLFDEPMFALIADETNRYAQKKIQGGVSAKSRLQRWNDINSCDVKLFLSHIVAMGLCRKSRMERYWSQGPTTETPFFGKYLSKNIFQLLLSNLHLNNDENNPRRGEPGHDPLHKIRPFVDMCEKNFRNIYQPEKELSFDEGCCPFKGRLKFKCYNPSKPNRFHIKLFQVCEAESGYISGFEIYTGAAGVSCAGTAPVLDENCTRTTKLVVGLLHKSNLLNEGRHVYMDNYYSSPELMMELFDKKTFSAGTVRANRKGLPLGVTKNRNKLKKGEVVFRRNGPLLALAWHDKRSVYMISTIHAANMVSTGRVDHRQNLVEKPEPIYYYVKLMGGVDLGDQLMSYYSFLRRSVKWWRKLFVHIFNMVLLNAFVLQKKFAAEPLGHEEFRECIVDMLLREGLQGCSINSPARISRRIVSESRLTERHFASFIPSQRGAKRSKPTRPCFLCSQVKEINGVKINPKWSSYWCGECKKVLCIDYCFETFHTKEDYKAAITNKKICDKAMPENIF